MEATMANQQQAEALLQAWQDRMQTPEPNRVYVAVQPDELLEAVGILHDARWGYLSAISGLDIAADGDSASKH